jgi:hypothetical protein
LFVYVYVFISTGMFIYIYIYMCMRAHMWDLLYTLLPTLPAGVNMKYVGSPPDDDDPFWCPWNPMTGQQYPRTVTMNLRCNPNVRSAIEIQAVQNSTEDCECVMHSPFHAVLCMFNRNYLLPLPFAVYNK